jgi:cardiolipin synthase
VTSAHDTRASNLTALADACACAAAALPAEQVRGLAERAAAITDPQHTQRIQDRPPTSRFRDAASAIVTAWKSMTPPVSGSTVAGMLLASLSANELERHRETVDLVWTGPGTDTIRGQATSDVVVELINKAQRTLVIATFASRRVQKVRDALLAATERGVKVTLILENENTNGQYLPAARDPFEGIPAEILEWPADKRSIENQWSPALHAKFVLVDESTVLVTSANLTGYALDKNIEAGVLINGGPLPGRLMEHLRDLAYNGILTTIDPHQ